MGLTRFYADDNDVDWCAAVEQMTLSYGIYFNGNQWVLDVVKRAYGDVELIDQTVDPAAYFDGSASNLPRWLAFRHNAQLYVVIMGTRSVFQWVQNVLSATNKQIVDSIFCTKLGQRNWIDIAEVIRGRLHDYIVSHAGEPVNVSGHSLGGVVAWLLGAKIKHNSLTQGVRVNVMTFGSPRQAIGVYEDPCRPPDWSGNVQTRDDVVTVLPPNVIPFGTQWQQQGETRVVQEDGTLDERDANATLNYLPLDERRFTRHYPGTYLNYLLRRYEDTQICPGGTLPLLVAANLKSATAETTPVLPSPPRPIDGYSPDALVAASNPSFHIGGNMALMKVSFLFNWGGKRFSETFYRDGTFDPQPTGQDANGNLSKSGQLLKARAALLCSAAATEADGTSRPVPVGYRMSEVESPFKSLPYITPASIASITSGLTGDRDNLVYLRAVMSNNSRRVIRLKGAPKDWIAPDPSKKIGTASAGLAAALAPFVIRLLTDGWGALVQTLSNERAITSISTLTAAIPEAPAGSWVIKAAGTFTPNQRIYVKGARGQGLRGFGGKYRVVVIQSDGSLVLNETKCDPCPLKISSLGSIWDRAVGLSTFSSVTFAGWGNGVLGNGNFFAEAGRRPACCR